VVEPPGECKDIRDMLIALAKETDEEMAKYFAYDNAEQFIQVWADGIPGGLDQLKKTGIWEDKSQPPAYIPYLQRTTYSTSDSSVKIDEQGVARLIENNKVIGRLWNGEIVKGFSTPDRKFQFSLPQIGQLLKSDNPITPAYRPIKSHKDLGEDEYILTTFKWNVHTQSRTANQSWLTEIVGDNPCWIHPATAEVHGIQDGQEFKLISRGRNGKEAYISVKPVITEAVHPKVLAISASFGHWQYGRTAKGKGYNPNPMILSGMDPVGGGQAWNDTVVVIEPVS
jgi:anaerobic selenocysteine-containing dehydrogenase